VSALTPLYPRQERRPADLILYNGTIHTMEPKFRTVPAIAVGGGRILATGTDAELRALAGSKTEVVDLRGVSVLPGINDSHLHAMFWSLGGPPFTLDVAHPNVKSIADISEAVRRAATSRKPGEWIQGRGWDQSYFAEGRAPTRADLDAAAPDHPVLLTEFSGHAIWVNGRALELAGITRDTEAPPGGVIVKDSRGEPTGVFFEGAAGLVRRKLPELSDADRARAIEVVMDRMAAAGITSFTEPGLDLRSIRIYQEKARAGALKARLTALIMGGRSVAGLRQVLHEAQSLPKTDERVMRIAGIKIHADGIPTINKTAWVSEPYVGGGTGDVVVEGS
jgi:predicted amidohydrolase YtcJ